MRRLWFVALLAIASVGCGSSTMPTGAPTIASTPPSAAIASTGPVAATVAPPATATPAPAITPSPTPTVFTIAQAAEAYATLAKTYNAAVKAADKKYGNTYTLKSQKKFWAAVAKATDAFITGLKAIPFPPEAAADAKALLKACVVVHRRAVTASKSASIADLNYNANLAMKADITATDKAAILRDDLGLPTNG